jgi:hypothetical protein
MYWAASIKADSCIATGCFAGMDLLLPGYRKEAENFAD